MTASNCHEAHRPAAAVSSGYAVPVRVMKNLPLNCRLGMASVVLLTSGNSRVSHRGHVCICTLTNSSHILCRYVCKPARHYVSVFARLTYYTTDGYLNKRCILLQGSVLYVISKATVRGVCVIPTSQVRVSAMLLLTV
jgi:hypothetical protein